jgi:hypothetical protein
VRASVCSTGVANARIRNREEMLVPSSSTTPALLPAPQNKGDPVPLQSAIHKRHGAMALGGDAKSGSAPKKG